MQVAVLTAQHVPIAKELVIYAKFMEGIMDYRKKVSIC